MAYKIFRAVITDENGNAIDQGKYEYSEMFLNNDIPFTIDTRGGAEKLIGVIQNTDQVGKYEIREVKAVKKANTKSKKS